MLLHYIACATTTLHMFCLCLYTTCVMFYTTVYCAGALLDAIKRDFGSVDAFRTQMSAKTVSIQGSGWGWLVCRTKEYIDHLFVIMLEVGFRMEIKIMVALNGLIH